MSYTCTYINTSTYVYRHRQNFTCTHTRYTYACLKWAVHIEYFYLSGVHQSIPIASFHPSARVIPCGTPFCILATAQTMCLCELINITASHLSQSVREGICHWKMLKFCPLLSWQGSYACNCQEQHGSSSCCSFPCTEAAAWCVLLFCLCACVCVCWYIHTFINLTLTLVHVPQTSLLTLHISILCFKGCCANMPGATGHVLQKKPSLACDLYMRKGLQVTGMVCLPVTTEKWVLKSVLVTQLHMPCLFICLKGMALWAFFSGQCVVYVWVCMCASPKQSLVSQAMEQTMYVPVNRVSASSVTTVLCILG